MKSNSALTSKEKEEFFAANLEEGFAQDRTRLYSRQFDRIPIRPEHGIKLRNSNSEICDDVEFIDVSPVSLRMRFPIELWMDGTLSVKQHGVHHSISRGRILSVRKNQMDAVFIITPELRIE